MDVMHGHDCQLIKKQKSARDDAFCSITIETRTTVIDTHIRQRSPLSFIISSSVDLTSPPGPSWCVLHAPRSLWVFSLSFSSDRIRPPRCPGRTTRQMVELNLNSKFHDSSKPTLFLFLKKFKRKKVIVWVAYIRGLAWTTFNKRLVKFVLNCSRLHVIEVCCQYSITSDDSDEHCCMTFLYRLPKYAVLRAQWLHRIGRMGFTVSYHNR